MPRLRPRLALLLPALLLPALAACDKPEQTPRPAAPPAPRVEADTARPAPPRPDASGEPNVRFDPTAPDTDLATTGTVLRVEVEGGGWVIETPQGTFQPTSLAPAFQRDGQKVAVTLRPRPDLMSTLQAGPLADVLAIRAL